MECMPVLHNFFMTFVRNAIYISSFDLSATIMEERSAHNALIEAARLDQQASTKEENSNTCGATKDKVGHWVVLSCCCCFWMKICPQTCAACCGRLCAVFILLMSANKKRTKNHILFSNKIFKSKKKISAMLTKIVMLAQKFLRLTQELIKYTARFPIAKPPF